MPAGGEATEGKQSLKSLCLQFCQESMILEEKVLSLTKTPAPSSSSCRASLPPLLVLNHCLLFRFSLFLTHSLLPRIMSEIFDFRPSFLPTCLRPEKVSFECEPKERRHTSQKRWSVTMVIMMREMRVPASPQTPGHQMLNHSLFLSTGTHRVRESIRFLSNDLLITLSLDHCCFLQHRKDCGLKQTGR